MHFGLMTFLAREQVPFELLTHREAYTAQARAAAAHVPGRLVAKAVVVRDSVDDWCALAVIPAHRHVDLTRMRALTGRPRLRLADEAWFSPLFADCEVGAIPPFGRMFGGLAVYLDEALAAQDCLVASAGTHHEELRVPMSDYLRIARPEIARLSTERRAA